MKLFVERSGALVADQIDRAETFWTRLVGLLGHPRLAPGHGLLIAPCNSVHTFFMRFTIDVAFLDKQGNVVRTVANLKPWRATKIHPKAHATLELCAGALAQAGVLAGDRLVEQAPNLELTK
jgi:uncharacterized membrane protein (UPF0127 family)